MTVINLTGETVHVGGSTFLSNGKLAFLSYQKEGILTGLPVDVIRHHSAICRDLPAPVDGVYYLVSNIVRRAFPSRMDLLSVHVGGRYLVAN